MYTCMLYHDKKIDSSTQVLHVGICYRLNINNCTYRKNITDAKEKNENTMPKCPVESIPLIRREFPSIFARISIFPMENIKLTRKIYTRHLGSSFIYQTIIFVMNIRWGR